MREGNCQGKKLKIEFHFSYLLMAFGFLFTGYYLNFIIFTVLILVHELGHWGMAKMFGIKVLKIVIYPYGGKCVLEDFVNRDLHQELLVAMAGVLVQFVFYLSICFFHDKGLIRDYVMNLFTLYNNQMIFFNLLPIYPLDGGRIVHLFLCFLFPYYLANLLVVGISFLVIIGIFLLDIYQCNYSNLMIMGLLIGYLVKFYQKRKFLYHKFLLERYLYDIRYSTLKVIRDLRGMYRNRVHVFRMKEGFQEEKEVLTKVFWSKKI